MKNWAPENIKSLREKYNLAQRELGELLRVSQNYIHLLEKEVRKPSKTLCLLLDCIEEKLMKKGGG